jgi:hypothetical protein
MFVRILFLSLVTSRCLKKAIESTLSMANVGMTGFEPAAPTTLK